ncbi:MAG: hypothetical protein ACRDAM_05525 [Casimicrobium sp.]
MNEHVASDNISAERVAESDVLRHVTKGKWTARSAYTLTEEGHHRAFVDSDDTTMHAVALAAGRTAQEALANARLMAASKEMAEALRTLQKSHLFGKVRQYDPKDGLVLLVDAALKKAGIE